MHRRLTFRTENTWLLERQIKLKSVLKYFGSDLFRPNTVREKGGIWDEKVHDIKERKAKFAKSGSIFALDPVGRGSNPAPVPGSTDFSGEI